MLRIAILGVGWAGTRHVEAIRELEQRGGRDDVTVACLVDNDPAFLEQKAHELGIEKTYVDYRQALDDPDVDAVSICLPHQLHAPVAIEAAQAGKDVLVEKPMATTVDEATMMIEAANAYDVALYVAENVVYAPPAKMLRNIVQAGQYIGELTAAAMVRGFQFSYPEETLSSYAQEMAAFADYVAGEAIGPTTGWSERRSLAIVQAGYESAASGEPIDLSVRFGDFG